MASTPAWALSLAYWLHMLATVTWIGSMVAMSLFVVPAAREALDGEAFGRLLGRIRRRLTPYAWLSLAVLFGTGMLQLTANTNYKGLLAIENRWAAAILAKHLLVFTMMGVSAYLTWGILPALERNALRRQRGLDVSGSASLQRRQALLLRLNLILGIIVLGLTAIARAS